MRFIVKNRVISITARHPEMTTFLLTKLWDRAPGNAWISSKNEERLNVEVYSSCLGFNLVNVKADEGDYRYLSAAIPLDLSVAITQADPVVVKTKDPHELETGMQVYFFDLAGMIELNETEATITKIDEYSFSLDGVDGSGFTAHTVATGELRQLLKSDALVFRDVKNLEDFMEGIISNIQESWGDLPYHPASGRLQINLRSNLNKQDNIVSWGSATTNQLGRFRDQDVNPVVLDHFIKVDIGSIVLFDASTATVNQISRAGSGNIKIYLVANVGLVDNDWILLDGVSIGGSLVKIDQRCFKIIGLSGTIFELDGTDKIDVEIGTATGLVSRVYQVIKILGDGTKAAAVTLSPDPAATTLTVRKILTGISTGLVDGGYVFKFKNYNKNRGDDRHSYSPKDLLPHGKIDAEHRGSLRTPTGDVVMHVDDYNKFIDFAEEFDGEPFSCLLQDFGSKSRNAGYFIMKPFPKVIQNNGEWYKVKISMFEFK